MKYYEYDPSRLDSPRRLSQVTAYDRCKANRRCNWGIVGTYCTVFVRVQFVARAVRGIVLLLLCTLCLFYVVMTADVIW